MYRYKILIIDDDRLLQNSLRNILSEKYETIISGSGEAGLEIVKTKSIDLVLLDIRLPGIDGIETLRRLKKINNDLTIVMMTAYEDVKTVITSMKMGATDYMVKPLDIEELDIIIEKTIENLRLKREVEELRKQCMKDFDIENIIGESYGIKEAMKLVNKIAQSYGTTVLLEGATGTGKEVIARAIHTRSARFGKPFVTINCGAISKDLIESELFGYDKGTFTGGLSEGKKGKFEVADGGTILLDEVSEMLPAAQVKLLRFLEEKAFFRVGGNEKRKVDVRIIAATNKNLEEAIREGTFRSDLFYRLNVAKIYLPPLCMRKEDIVPLIYFFMDKFNEAFKKNFTGISREAQELVVNLPWVGNIRELRNAVERAMLLNEGPLIEADYLSFLEGKKIIPIQTGQTSNGNFSLEGMNLDELNKKLIIQALEMCNGNRTKAAKLLSISRPTMIYRIEKYNISIPSKT